jgi:iron complex outermembrane receptor protein
VGSLFNKGIEFSVNAKPVVTKNFTWDLTYNVTYNYNEVTKITSNATVLDAGESISSGTGNKVQAVAEGFPAWSYYVYEQVYDSNNKPIEGLYVDRNGDGNINDDDRYMYHHAAPDVTMGFSSKFIYKNLDLGFSMHANMGNYVFNDVAASKANIGISGVYSTSGFLSNVSKSALETNFTGKTNWYFSDYYVQNASFLRLDNITLGYSFKHIAGLKVNGRVSATAQNVATFTKYKGLDPEMSGGIDKSIYPRPFQTVVGLTLNF